MATFSALQQQETNRKILEDLQLKKQLLQKSTSIASINQMSAQPDTGSAPTVPRSVNPNSSPTTLGYFVQQDSFYGNTFIPVLPRFDPLPTTAPQLSPIIINCTNCNKSGISRTTP